MDLTMLGTGHAMVTECYNTCFVIRDGRPGISSDTDRRLLVDGGGGIGLLRQLRLAGLGPTDVREVFVTHRHLDHMLGVVWLIRVWTQSMLHQRMEGCVRLYAHDEVCDVLREMARLLLNPQEAQLVGERVCLMELHDREPVHVMGSNNARGHELIPFDIHSTKAKQFGFRMELEPGGDRWLTCCGDEPLPAELLNFARNSTWLLHEAFCLRSEEDKYHPSRMHHSTVADACELAEASGAQNLVLYHARDDDLASRQRLYLEEGRRFYGGNLYAPYDLDVIELVS